MPAEQGGKGFKGEGWETNTDFDLIGDPKAVKGGELKHGNMSDFPSTLRYYGPNITAWNQMVNAMVYETLSGCIRRRSTTSPRSPHIGRSRPTR